MNKLTEEYSQYFKDKEPIEIYSVPRKKLMPTNRALSWYREKTVGIDAAGEYRRDLFGQKEEIRVTQGLPRKVEEEIVKHEVNHYLKHGEEVLLPQLVMISGGLMILPAAFGFLPRVFAQTGVVVAVSGLLYGIYHQTSVEEKEANEGVELSDALNETFDFSSYSDGYITLVNYGEKFIGLSLLIPSGFYMKLKSMKNAFLGKI